MKAFDPFIMNRGTACYARRGARNRMRNAARLFLVLMSATFAVAVVLEAASWVSAAGQERVDRAISATIDV